LLINVFVVFPSGKNLLYQLFRTAEAGEPHLPVAIGSMKERYGEECQIEQGARFRSSSSSDVLPTKRPESGLYDSA
jgi:hypothetical protein